MNSDSLAARIEKALGSTPSSDADQIPSQPPPPIPNHEIIGRIGAGSYGEVWLARSVTGALRAIKVVWRNRFSSERPYEREFRGIVNFEPISRSQAGVVHVLHVGRDDAAGCFFYVMELADDAPARPSSSFSNESEIENEDEGRARARPEDKRTPDSYAPRTLASELKSRGRLPVTDAVSLGVQLAGALGHLHRHGLVHRDVKPSNVIFVQGQPKLADIGLVTGVNEERSFVGTEGFIPPEGPGSERADLFALGRLLYEAVTGKSRSDFPALPDDLDRWPNGEREALIELNEVLARACAPDAKQRHKNAAELAGDLNLILAGRSVRRAYRVERQLRRATVIATVALVVVFATIFSNWLQHRQREQSDERARRETTLRQRAEAAERESRRQLYTALLEQARATVLSGEVGQRVRALDAIKRAAAISNSAELRREAFAALALADLRFERELPYGQEFIMRWLDPPFQRMALTRGRGEIEIRSVADDRLLATLPASTNLTAFYANWSADGRYLAVKREYPPDAWRGDWEIWDVAASRQVLLFRDVPRLAVAFHPRLPQLLVWRKGDLSIWNLQDGRELARLPRIVSPGQLEFSPDGGRFASARGPGMAWTVWIHDTMSGLLVSSNTVPEPLQRFKWHPSGRWLAGTGNSGAVYWIDAQGDESRVLGRHKAEARWMEFSPDGTYLMTGGWEREMICWDTRTLQRAFTVRLGGYVSQFREDARAFAIQTRSGLQLHAFEQPSGHREFAEELGIRVQQAAFSANGQWLAASGNKRMGVWNLTTTGPGALEEKGQNTHCFFTPDGQQLFASRRVDATTGCFRWRITSATNAQGPPRLEPLPLRTPPGYAFVSLSSNSVVMTGTNGTQLLSLDEVESLRNAWMPTAFGLNRASPDGRWVGISRRYSSSLYVHGLPGLEPITKLKHLAEVHHFEFSPRGHEVAICSRQGVELYSTANWERTCLLTNFDRSACLYTPNGRGLWLTRGLSAAGLYNARTLEPLLLLPTGMLPLAMSTDGRRLAVSVEMQRLQVWDLVEVRERLRELELDWAEKQ